jgi:tetratricopeptide (TPR) repeat protein
MANSPAKVRLSIPQATDRAVNFQRTGWFSEAEIIYTDILKVEPDHFDSTHNLGVIRFHQGRLEEALPLLEHAIKLDPNSADAQSNHGVVLRALRRWPEALDAFDRAIKLRPDYPEAYSNRGGVLIDLGRTEEALEAFNRAMIARRGFVDALLGRGIALARLRRFSDALIAFGRVIGIDPNHAEALIQRAYPLIELRRYEEAVASCDRSIAVNPRNPAAHFQRGTALSALGRPADAAASFQQALVFWPDFVEALFNLSNELQRLGRFDEALAAIDRCLTLDPGQYGGWNNRGNILLAMGRYTDAMESYDRTLSIKPDYGEAYYNKGNALRELARLSEASECFEKAVALNSVHPDISLNEGLARLLAGDLRHGFKRYEGRFQKTEHAPQIRKLKQPRWTGFDIAGKRILLHDEQGLGDAIHFARYVPLVAQRGAEVILQVQASLKILLASVKGVSQVYERDARLPEFDVHQYLLSLAEVFETELDSIPAEVPYIAAPADRLEKWRKRLPAKHGLRVGLVWSGNPAFAGDASRSIGLWRLTSLLSVPGVQFVSLHSEVRAEDAPFLQKFPELVHFGAELTDFADTAAIVTDLDLVIGSDTAVIHLAGALAKPVWVLTKFSPDWRWLLDREDNPWYPTAKLYRQPQIGDWASVVDRVRQDLIELSNAANGR